MNEKFVKRVDILTDEQKSKMEGYAQYWISKGLQTGETDFETFEKYIPLAYKKAKIKFPKKVIRVSSPLVGAIASSIAGHILNRGAVSGAVGGAVGDESSTKSIISSIIKNYNLKSIQWHYWIGGQFWVGLWWYLGTPSINFLFDACKLKLSKDIMERAEINRKISESVGYYWVNRDFVMVSERPQKLMRNESGQLHNDQGKAIEWSDGWGLYMLDGVRIDEPSLYWKIVSHIMSFSEIMKIEISDIRTVALKYNPKAIIKENAKLIHRDDRNNELYLVENAEINRITNFPKMYFVKMLCPTGRIFIEGVEPNFAEAHPNATECQAELCGLVLSDYQAMKLES